MTGSLSRLCGVIVWILRGLKCLGFSFFAEDCAWTCRLMSDLVSQQEDTPDSSRATDQNQTKPCFACCSFCKLCLNAAAKPESQILSDMPLVLIAGNHELCTNAILREGWYALVGIDKVPGLSYVLPCNGCPSSKSAGYPAWSLPRPVAPWERTVQPCFFISASRPLQKHMD